MSNSTKESSRVPFYKRRIPPIVVIGFLLACLCCLVAVFASPTTKQKPTTVEQSPTQAIRPTDTPLAPMTKATETPKTVDTPISTSKPAATQTIAQTSTKTSIPRPTNTSTPVGPKYVSMLGKVWSGVKVYYGTGSTKTYGFEIVGGAERCPSMPSGRGIKVRYKDGTVEWKDRNHIISSGLYYVLEDDPAIKAMDWYVFSDCP